MRKRLFAGLLSVFLIISGLTVPAEASSFFKPEPETSEETPGSPDSISDSSMQEGDLSGVPETVDLVTAYGMGDVLYTFANANGDFQMQSASLSFENSSDSFISNAAPQPIARSDSNIKYLILVDSSKSRAMVNNKNNVNKFIRSLVENESHGSVVFTVASFGGSFQVVEENITDVEKVVSLIEGLYGKEKDTDIYGSLTDALDYLDDSDRVPGDLVNLIFISDGLHDPGDSGDSGSNIIDRIPDGGNDNESPTRPEGENSPEQGSEPGESDDIAGFTSSAPTEGRFKPDSNSLEKTVADLTEKIQKMPGLVPHAVFTDNGYNPPVYNVFKAGRGKIYSLEDTKPEEAGKELVEFADNLYRTDFQVDGWPEKDTFSIRLEYVSGQRAFSSAAIDNVSVTEGEELSSEDYTEEGTAPEPVTGTEEGTESASSTEESLEDETAEDEKVLEIGKDDTEAAGTESTGTELSPEEKGETKGFPWIIVICMAAAVIIILLIVLILLRKKPKNVDSPGYYDGGQGMGGGNGPSNGYSRTENPGGAGPANSSNGMTAQAAAGSSIPLRIEILTGNYVGEGRDFNLVNELFVGKDPSCNIVFSDPDLSPRNSRIYVQNNLVYIEDLHSEYGTAISGMRIYAPNRLRSGDEVSIGEVCFRVRF
ncbi:MAG: FHA domain-containing protein [Lachnospiraceae bacterium]|nr:FHA domain-containing protein [Lachnospiraceae bacterium]